MSRRDLFRRLLLLPMHRLLGRIACLGGTENMRMATDHLLDQAARHGSEIETALLFRQTAVENHLEQQVSQLLAKRGCVPPGDGIRYLVRFLERVRRDGVEGLLAIPRATALRRPQLRHQGDHAPERRLR